MRWRDPNPVIVPEALRRLIGGRPIVAERLARAGLIDLDDARAFLDPQAYTPTSPFELPDIEIAVERLGRAVRSAEPILIWGDFDVDGQTATALLYTALLRLGADVRYHVPLRDGEGHGMYLPKLREWLSRGVKVIMTCDTGITSHEAVEAASAAGVDVLITDHHLPGETLPGALAVINPMRLPAGHKLRELPGVGVAYELIVALTAGRDCDDLLDLVALGIVADVAELRNETRYLLQRGIATMRLSSRPGLQALFQSSEINPLELSENDIAFGLAPRLNAQGRLGDAKESVELLSTQDQGRAAELANQLEGMNARRRLETRMIEEGARSLIERDPSLLDYAAIVLSHPEWSGGIVGIVANRLAETYHKPVVLLCEKDERAFGSARSVAGFNLTEALRGCRDLLLKYGGHAMAAGLSLERNKIYDFRRRLSRIVREATPVSVEEPVLEIDGYLGLDEISIDLIEDLRRLAPFGNGNPTLTLATRDLRLIRRKKIGRRGEHQELTVEDEQKNQRRVLWWNAADKTLPDGKFDLAYSLRISRFKDRAESILELIDLRSLEAETVEVSPEQRPFDLEDYRHHPSPKEKLLEVLDLHPAALIWREDDPSIEGSNRTELRPAETLIIWTSPPGPAELNAALETVKPCRVIVFGRLPAEPTLESFLQRLAGLINHVMNAKHGETTINALAAAAAQRADTVRYGLLWFHQTGRATVDLREDGSVRIIRGIASSGQYDLPQLERLLQGAIAETNAYRKHIF